MRTTLTIDREVAEALRREMRCTGGDLALARLRGELPLGVEMTAPRAVPLDRLQQNERDDTGRRNV